MAEKRDPWIVEFSRRMRETGAAGGVAVLREAEEALGALGIGRVRAELEVAERSDVDPRLAQWLRQRLESPEARKSRQTRAYFQHLRGTDLATEGGPALEIGVEMIDDALLQIVRAEDVDGWSQMQHNLAEALMQREAGTRADNVERAVAAFCAALPGRRGGQRVDTLLGLAQALRKRSGGNAQENARDGQGALAEAERLLAKHAERKQAARVLLERATWEQDGERFESALEMVRRAAKQAVNTGLTWQVRDREATVLAAWGCRVPERREEALAANRALLLDEDTQTTRRLALVRSRLRALGAPPDPVTPDVLGHADLHWWKDDLGDAPLVSEIVQALELRIRREEREAFRLPSGRALVRREAELAPLVLRLAIELHRVGNERLAIAYLAHLGAWPLRRALRWTDSASSPVVERIRQSRILEDRLAEILRWASVLDLNGWAPGPVAPGSVERVQRYLSGVSVHVFLAADDLTALLPMPPDERNAVVAELHRGIESGIDAALEQLATERPPLFNSVTLPPFVGAGHFADKLPARQALVLLQNVKAELVLGAAWRARDGVLHTRLTRAGLPSAADARDLPVADDLARLEERFRQAGVERVGIVCRGVYAHLMATAVAPLAMGGRRLVHLAGVDEVYLPTLDRTRSRRYLVLLDAEPERALPCIMAASATLRDVGFIILRPGATLDQESAMVLGNAHGVIFAGHGEGTFGPFGPAIGRQFVSHFDQLPLRASGWGLCMACSAGDSGRIDDQRWDHDDPAGAAEHLLLAGCRHAADCLSPVPEVLAALMLEEFGVRSVEGEDPEAAFATTSEDWRAFFASLSGPLAECLVEGAPMDARRLSAWLTERLDAERRRRLRRDVVGLPPDSLFTSLGTRPPASLSAGTDRPRDVAWAREVAAQMLAPFVASSTWAAFRWMARR